MEPYSLKDVVTLVIASLGALLGIMNTWRAFDRDRAKLKVIPKQAIPVGGMSHLDPRTRLCIEVTNLSTFPLTVTEVGVMYHGTKSRGAIIHPIVRDGGPFPRRLDARSSVTLYAHPEALHNSSDRIKCAYASTDCGLLFKGSTPALHQLACERAG